MHVHTSPVPSRRGPTVVALWLVVAGVLLPVALSLDGGEPGDVSVRIEGATPQPSRTALAPPFVGPARSPGHPRFASLGVRLAPGGVPVIELSGWVPSQYQGVFITLDAGGEPLARVGRPVDRDGTFRARVDVAPEALQGTIGVHLSGVNDYQLLPVPQVDAAFSALDAGRLVLTCVPRAVPSRGGAISVAGRIARPSGGVWVRVLAGQRLVALSSASSEPLDDRWTSFFATLTVPRLTAPFVWLDVWAVKISEAAGPEVRLSLPLTAVVDLGAEAQDNGLAACQG